MGCPEPRCQAGDDSDSVTLLAHYSPSLSLTNFDSPYCNTPTFTQTITSMTLGDWGGHLSTILDRSDVPLQTFIVFLLYNVVVIVVTMNIFLSIVLDAYSSIKKFQEEEESSEKLAN